MSLDEHFGSGFGVVVVVVDVVVVIGNVAVVAAAPVDAVAFDVDGVSTSITSRVLLAAFVCRDVEFCVFEACAGSFVGDTSRV